MSADASRLGIVVVNYGSSALLRRNLAAIDRTALEPVEIVVVDNPTSPAERRTVRELARVHGWRVVEPAANGGFGAGMNAGVRQAIDVGCTVLLCLNPDVSIDATSITEMVEVVRRHPRTLISPRLERPDGSLWFAGGQIDRETGMTRSRPDERQIGSDRWLTGACLFLDRASWDLTGGFDDRYFLYWEDIDLSQRMIEGGGQLLVWHQVVATHDVGATQLRQRKSPMYVRYNCRNRLLFSTTHLGPRGRLRWLAHAPRYAVRVLLRDGRKAALRRPAMVLAAARGTLEGAWFVLASIVATGDGLIRR